MIWTETDILNQMIAAEREKEEEEKKWCENHRGGSIVLAASRNTMRLILR